METPKAEVEYVWLIDLVNTKAHLETRTVTIGTLPAGGPFQFASYRPMKAKTWPQWREALEIGGLIEAHWREDGKLRTKMLTQEEFVNVVMAEGAV